MATFQDDEGRDWVVRFDHALLLNIRKRLGVDLHHMAEQAKALDRMADGDIELLANVLYLACEAQCKQRAISDEQFGQGLAAGETIERAIDALKEAILSFTLPQRRAIVRQTMETMLGVRQKAEELVANLVTKAVNEANQTMTSGV